MATHRDDDDLALGLAMAELAGREHRAAVARRLGLADVDALALEALLLSGELTPRELAGVLGLSSGGLTSLADRLEAAGDVQRRPNPADGRSRVLSLTAQGRGKADACSDALSGPVNETAGWLSEQDAATVGRFLRQLATMRGLRARTESERLARSHRRVPPAAM